MHIVENKNEKAGRTYCYACECLWDKSLGKYNKPRVSIGHLEGVPPHFVPNRYFAQILAADPSLTGERDKLLIATAVEKYGEGVFSLGAVGPEPPNGPVAIKTARAVFTGPSIVFGGITRRYRIDAILKKAFGEEAALDILSLAWYISAEGAALGNSDAWLEHFETPRKRPISSQDITRLLDGMGQDGIMTFYREWLASLKRTGDRVLYDLTSISWNGRGIDLANWGHNRNNDNLPQVNYALLCARSTAMPLFAWPLEGSMSDTRTLQNTLQLLDKLGYKPDCLMMDRGFASQENITYMLRRGYTFLQALRVNAGWIREIIDAGKRERLRPDSMVKAGDRTYYSSTVKCQWVLLRRTAKKRETEETLVYLCNEARGEKYTASDEGVEILFQHPCNVHVLFCQDLVGGQWDRFMESLNEERSRLLADENASVRNGFERYFRIEKKKYARHRTVEFNIESIEQHRDRYAGHICFITNDRTIARAEDALREYSTRDYIEKDFDELKNDLDMKRIRVHTDDRMRARLLIQFIAEIMLREIRVRLRDSEECSKMTRRQIFSHIKGIYKISFEGKYRDVKPELSKSQRVILEALGLRDIR
jgi:transposase